jgi:hypothetical protein
MHFFCFFDRNGPIGPLGTNSFRGGDAVTHQKISLYIHVTKYSTSINIVIGQVKFQLPLKNSLEPV